MSQENLTKLSNVMEKITTAHGAAAEIAEMASMDSKLHQACVEHSKGTNALLEQLRRKMTEEQV